MTARNWNYSWLKNWETCAKRFYHYDLAKDIPFQSSPQLDAGNRLHDAFDKRLQGIPLPLGMGMFEKLLAPIVKAPGTLLAEQWLAIDENFQAVPSKSPRKWIGSKIDCTIISPDRTRATVFDWKDGAVKPDSTQLEIYATLIFANMPEVQTVHASLVFVNYESITREEWTREDLPEIWARLMPRYNAMQRAREAQEFPPKPSGLCKKYCGVVSCPHHGR